MVVARIESNNTYEPWSYKPNYKLTSKLLNSKKTIVKIARYTGVILVFVALAETIREVIKMPFKLIGNLFRLYKFTIFKTHETDKRSTDEIIQNLKSIEHTQIIPTWKKALYLSGTLLTIGSLVYISYPYASNYLSNLFSKKEYLQLP